MKNASSKAQGAGLDTLSWPEGVLLGCHLRPGPKGEAILDLKVALKEQTHPGKRRLIAIRCSRVSRLHISSDAPQLKDNVRAGNIVDGLYRTGALRLALRGGAIEVAAGAFQVRPVRAPGRKRS